MARLFAACPGSAWVVRRAALAPVILKTELFSRAVSMIAAKTAQPGPLIDTNLGIADALRCEIPVQKNGLLFGAVRNYTPERATLELAAILSRRSAAFLDVGANEGIFTFSVACALGPARHHEIHLFEPDPELFARLARNLQRNGINALANRAAVGRDSGMATFYRNLSDDLSGSLTTVFSEKHQVEAVETPVFALGDYLAKHEIERACLKIDVEGAGLAVWEGLSAQRERIDWLIYEILVPEVKAGLARIILADGRWHAYYIRDFELVQSIDGEFDYRAPFYNWLFCAPSPAELATTLAGTPFRIVPARGRKG